MQTKLIMTLSAIVLGLAGIVFTFLPEEILTLMQLANTRQMQLLIQIPGALYFGFAMLNWMSRANIIGGIYNRPLVVANFSHFFIAALALIKALIADSEMPKLIWAAAAVYAIFAILFTLILFRNPAEIKNAA